MSTKVYNGYVLPLMSVKELNAFVLRFKNEAREVIKNSSAVFIAESMVSMMDSVYFLEEKEYIKRFIKTNADKKTLSDCAYLKLFREAVYAGHKRYSDIQLTYQRDPVVDFDCEICFIPTKGKLLALFFSEQANLQKLWESMKEVKYYGYWNNTDADENCTEKEWEERKKDWESVLPGLGIPSENGMVISVSKGFPEQSEIDKEKVLQSIPDFKTRLNRVAKETLLKELCEKEDMKEEDKYSVYQKARSEMKTKESEERLLQIQKELESKLIKNVDETIFKLTFDKIRN